MRNSTNRWALVLAAGSGTRLSSLTTIGAGEPVPKQFCSLNGGASLLEETLERAFSITVPRRVIVVVAAEHDPFWRDALDAIPRQNIVVQPRNRGTAIGILLGVVAVLARDADARLVVLPSDHYVGRERVLERSISETLASLDAESGAISFLGIEPDSADPELGYIVRGNPDGHGGYGIAEFVEKPSSERARDLIQRAALWNSFILIATARAFVDLVGRPCPGIARAFLDAAGAIRDGDSAVVEALYADLPGVDFSRDIVERADAPLCVVPVPACGWSDLGTPVRVAACLDRLDNRPRRIGAARLSLAEAHLRLQRMSTVAEQWA